MNLTTPPRSTHLNVILDRSLSMVSIRDETIEGFNTFLDEQRSLPGEATLTLVQFDTHDPYEIIYDFKPLADIPPLSRETFVPRAATPLLDTMGRGIVDLERKIEALPEGDRPDTVIMAVITDGKENSSQEFNRELVRLRIEEKEKERGWQFLFLGADMEAIADARGVGISEGGILWFSPTGPGTLDMWVTLSATIGQVRTGLREKAEFPKKSDH